METYPADVLPGRVSLIGGESAGDRGCIVQDISNLESAEAPPGTRVSRLEWFPCWGRPLRVPGMKSSS